MRVLGLFIGVDRQADESIRQLTFAGRDAEGLWAAFADLNEYTGLGDSDDTVLLMGIDATQARIREALRRWTARSQEHSYDLAMLHFSCHGLPSRQLLGADAVRGEEATTGISFDEIASCVRQVRAIHVITSFDTCFSGLAAHAALFVPPPALVTDADVTAFTADMNGLAGGNRAVVYAARPDQQAWGLARLGHGVLSYGLLKGLDGTTLVEPGGVSLSRWMDEAVKVAGQEAARDGKPQTPGRLMHWSGTPMMPASPIGPRRVAFHAGLRPGAHITNEVGSLAAVGFDAAAIDAIRARIDGGDLLPMQVRALTAGGVLAGGSVVVAAPTSSGKTLIAEIAALTAARLRRKTAYLVPSRALAHEKWDDFRQAFGEPLGLRAVRSFGGVDDDDMALDANRYDIAFFTYEKFLGLVLTRPSILDAIGTVVLDEAHLIGDPARGRSVELLLARLRARRVTHGLQLIALSAALGTLNGFPEWLGAGLVREEERPVELVTGVLTPDGMFRYQPTATASEVEIRACPAVASRQPGERREDVATRLAAGLAMELLPQEQERLLIFRSFKPDTRRLAKAIGEKGTFEACTAVRDAIAPAVAGRDDSRATKELLDCIDDGVGFHLGDLERAEREAVEVGFRHGELRCLVATSGLAMGINTPASSVIIADHQHYNGSRQAMEPYPVGEMRNMAGRAGRWIRGSRAGRGTAYLIAIDEDEADYLRERYILGPVEPLESQLSGVPPADLVLGSLAVLGPTTPAGLWEFVRDTFDGYQHRPDPSWRQTMRERVEAAVLELEGAGFARRTAGGGLEATETGSVCGRSGLAFESARSILKAAREVADHEPLDELALVTLAQLTAELDAIFAYPDGGENWPRLVTTLLENRPRLFRTLWHPDPSRFIQRLKRVFAMVRWTQGTPMSKIEAEFSAHAEGRKRDDPYAGTIRQVAARTTDVLRAVGRLVALQHPDQQGAIRIAVLEALPRLEHGIARKATGLSRHGLGLSRGEMHKLATLGITSFPALHDGLRKRTAEVIAIVGSSKAARILATMDRRAASHAKAEMAERQAQASLFDGLAALNEL